LKDHLAALPFPIVITTNYDQLFDIALYRANTLAGKPKQPIVRVYDPHRTGPPEEVPLDPSEGQPILLKLHGDLNNPGSIVVTEEDYLVFIQKMSDLHQHPIPLNIRARMNSWPILFIGYSLKDYNLRLLFRTLRWHLTVADFPLSFSVDPFPDDLIVSVFQRGGKPMVNFIEENLWDFVPALYRACTGVEYQS
jgi:SIR2-like domain